MKPIAVDCQLNHVHFILIANSIRYNILLIFNRSNRTVLFNQIKPLYKIITATTTPQLSTAFIWACYIATLYSPSSSAAATFYYITPRVAVVWAPCSNSILITNTDPPHDDHYNNNNNVHYLPISQGRSWRSIAH